MPLTKGAEIRIAGGKGFFPHGCENQSPRMAGYGEESWEVKLTEEKLEIR